jgi:hypothetical protein
MFRALKLASLIGLLGALPASAEPARFKFEKGQVLTYNIVQATKVAEVIIDEKTNKPEEQVHFTKNTVVRRWKIVDVDDKGVATLEMTIVSMRCERKLPDGSEDVFDSAKPDKLNKDEMAKMVGPVLAIVRVDTQGKLVEVKESKFGSNRLSIELPLKLVLPDASPKEGQSWEREFAIKLDPPQGTGESYDAVQKFTAKAPVNGFLTVGVATSIKDMPKEAADQIPLLNMLTEGDIFFHERTGRYQAARLRTKREVLNHQGEGTKYAFETTYAEDLKLEK